MQPGDGRGDQDDPVCPGPESLELHCMHAKTKGQRGMGSWYVRMWTFLGVSVAPLLCFSMLPQPWRHHTAQ